MAKKKPGDTASNLVTVRALHPIDCGDGVIAAPGDLVDLDPRDASALAKSGWAEIQADKADTAAVSEEGDKA